MCGRHQTRPQNLLDDSRIWRRLAVRGICAVQKCVLPSSPRTRSRQEGRDGGEALLIRTSIRGQWTYFLLYWLRQELEVVCYCEVTVWVTECQVLEKRSPVGLYRYFYRNLVFNGIALIRWSVDGLGTDMIHESFHNHLITQLKYSNICSKYVCIWNKYSSILAE